MHRHAAPQLYVPHRYPSGFWRMSDYTCHHVAVSRHRATVASTEHMLAELAAHKDDSAVMHYFQRMLRVTIDDWQRTDSKASTGKVMRR